MRRYISIGIIIAVLVLSLLFSANAKTLVFGDCNLDGKVTASDARIILRIASDLLMLDNADACFCADTNRDGKIRATDARLALRIAATLSMGASTFVDDDIAFSPTTWDLPITAKPSTKPFETASVTAATELTTRPVFSAYGYNDCLQNMQKPEMPDVPTYTPVPNSFTIITYGYGHGVGLSQNGAIGMAINGYSYLDILTHYYVGVSVIKESIPEKITLYTGEQVDTYELICRVVQQEIGGENRYYEALKAQAVTAYSIIKYHNFVIPNSSTVAYKQDFSSCSDAVKNAVKEVLGQYMEYNGKCICAVFGAMSAGITADETDVWGGDYEYLRPVTSYYDMEVSKYITWEKFIYANTFTVDQIKAYITAYDNSIVLSDDPAEWISITEHDSTISPSVGYVTQMRLGDMLLSERAGQRFRSYVMNYSIRSHCFSIIYYDNDCNPHYC